jgi:FtsP/CotA-like multicopper oxidase with cupredoxin domain
MRNASQFLLAVLLCGFSSVEVLAQCPPRPNPDTVVKDTLSLYSQNGVLSADLTLGHSVDANGYTHYCYMYKTPTGQIVEAPTLRLNPGDQLLLHVKDAITSDGAARSMSGMDMTGMPGVPVCGDTGTATLNSTNVHFHGLNIPPRCHEDDVLSTLIQPGTPGFQFNTVIPANEPPGLYWYHPHIHGFTEFQVNGGAAGAIVVEGMDKVRPEVSGLTERVFTIRQQFLVPWVPGPYQLTVNFETAGVVQGPTPIIQMKPGTKEFWRILNASLQNFMPLQVWFNSVPQPLQLIALDGYPLAQPRSETTILIPPASRAEFIVQAPPAGASALFMTLNYSTGPTGNADVEDPLAKIQLSADAANPLTKAVPTMPQVPLNHLKFAGLKDLVPTTTRKLYFSEEFGGTNGPIQFYITVDGQKQKVFEANEKPAITTKVGAVEDWTIENHALETHAFHIHQIHFMVLEVDGKPVPNQDLRDTIEIPFWDGVSAYHSVKVRMDFRDPTTAGLFVFHCHILLHEDLGMMHKILVEP